MREYYKIRNYKEFTENENVEIIAFWNKEDVKRHFILIKNALIKFLLLDKTFDQDSKSEIEFATTELNRMIETLEKEIIEESKEKENE